MEWMNKVAAGVILCAFLLLCAIAVFQFIENRSMRRVLIDHTVSRLNEQFDDAVAAEKRHLSDLSEELDELLAGLSDARGLTGDQHELIRRGKELTSEILGLTTMRGLEY